MSAREYVDFYLDPGAKLPFREHQEDSGMDLYALDDTVIAPLETALVSTGVHLAWIRDSHELQLRPRSSMSAKGIHTHFGTIDRTYTGDIKVCLTNLTKNAVRIEAGTKIAQLAVSHISRPVPKQVNFLPTTDRGSNGFGSTGK